MSKRPTKAQCEFATALADSPRVVAHLSEACKRHLANCRDVEHVTLSGDAFTDAPHVHRDMEPNTGWEG